MGNILIIRKVAKNKFEIVILQINDVYVPKRACLITLHSNFEIFQKGHPAVDVMLNRRIFER